MFSRVVHLGLSSSTSQTAEVTPSDPKLHQKFHVSDYGFWPRRIGTQTTSGSMARPPSVLTSHVSVEVDVVARVAGRQEQIQTLDHPLGDFQESGGHAVQIT